jgi:hypothetical protein
MTTAKINGAKVFRLNGREYILVYDLDACDFLDSNGLDPWGTGFVEALKTAKPWSPTLKLLLHAGLRRHHPEMTLEAIGKLRVGQVGRAMPVILDALNAQMTPDQEDSPAGPPAAGDSPGSSSGQSSATTSA